MTHRFRFQHDGEEYEVTGTYGHEQNQVFTVTKYLPGAVRMMRAPGGGQSGLKIEMALSVATELDLIKRLSTSFANLNNFRAE
jgi:hypothetical protein